MRRRTLLLTAGLLAYLFGATVRAYLNPDADLYFCTGVEYRILFVVEHKREALRHPRRATEFLLFKQGCYD
jgi:hypothetical protein